MKALYFLTILGLLFTVNPRVQAQCSSCTYTVTSGTANHNFNVNSGQTLCIPNGITFTGNISLGGGTVCNSGTIQTSANINFNSGKIYNYGTINRSGLTVQGPFYNYGKVSISGSLNINNNGEFYNEAGATLDVTGSVSNNRIFKNNGTATVGSYQANGSSSVSENTGTMTVKGNLQINSVFTNSGPLRVEGDFQVNGNATFKNLLDANVNVLGNYQNNGTTWNDGSIEVGGTFKNNGGGVYTNNDQTNIIGNFVNNGVINGDATGCNSFTVGGGSVVQNGGGSINNNDFCAAMFPGSNFSYNGGSTVGTTFCTCSGGVNPLPIELTAFTADCKGNGVELNWTTATEINNAFFTLYRSSDAGTWETVTVLAGAGNSNAELHYTYTDSRALNSVSYYRLQQTDYDGATEYFEPVSVHCGVQVQSHDMSVYPNPADEQFTVSVTASRADADAVVQLLDLTGKRILAVNRPLTEGLNYLTVDRNGLAAGTYFVQVASVAGEFGMQKVVLR